MRISDWSSDVCSSDLERRRGGPGEKLLIACPILPRIANFDDLDPLKLEPGVKVMLVPPGQPIPAEAALIILPGSKATIADLQAVRDQGWDIDIRAHRRRGRPILGICGGYQMLGRRIDRSEEHTSELQSLMRISYAVF